MGLGPNKKQNKAKLWDLIKPKTLAKETIKKRQKDYPQNGRKIFAKDGTDKGLISKIYKQLMQLKNKRQTTQLKNGQKT